MKKIISHINKVLKENSNVAICLGKLTDTQKSALDKHFKVTQEFFGYWKFEKK